MKKYSTVIFDLFDTIVNFNFNHLPSVELKGFRARTTSIEVYEVFKEYYPLVSFTDFYQPFMDSYHDFQQMKAKEFREFPNCDRFKLMLSDMGLESIEELEDRMVLAHMNALASCVEFPEENRGTLEYIRDQDYRLAIVSNFDYAPTAYMLIDKFEIRSLFEEIIISAEVGWRKPNDIIFNKALDDLKIKSNQALFVGDNYSADVIGSKSVGMHVAWINRKNESTKNLNPRPDYIIKKLSELQNFL